MVEVYVLAQLPVALDIVVEHLADAGQGAEIRGVQPGKYVMKELRR